MNDLRQLRHFVALAEQLEHRFQIRHPTIQIELDGMDDGCTKPAALG